MKMKRLVLSAVQEIADEFEVSLTAALLKLADSNRFPIVLVCHNKHRRRWFHAAPTIQRWWFRIEHDRESIAFEVLFGGTAEISYARKIGADA
jgi:hypothetical protein